MIEIKSFVGGRWDSGRGEKTVLVNPATEEPLAHAASAGVDFGAALSFARSQGQTLRAMSFAARGEILRAMSRAIHAHRDELITLAIANGGNTRSDAKFDIDGASGTLGAYADLAATLGEGMLTDGDAFQLGRSARLYGRHVWVPREGVAVHINAFNFPAWGFGEKAAVALLAGMPIVVKAATSTSLVAFRLMEIFASEGAIPVGAISFIASQPGDLLSHLTAQDVLAFTGSSATASLLRTNAAVVRNSVKLNVEADSLNAAVLGADVDSGDLMNLFVGDVVRDMTQKTGQKCTAIRRVIVPKNRVADVTAMIGERLAAVRIGDPSLENVTMGPLATARQMRDAQAGITRLAADSRTAFGGEAIRPIGVADGKGFFVGPVLFVHESGAPEGAAHTREEVFGPVATVVAYDGEADAAARIVAAGGGSLVSSVYSDDKDYLRRFVRGAAAFNGRVSIASTKIASQALQPGMVLPQLIHGGPGRAGGGEELGGMRGLSLYMQRVALQGDRALLDSIVG